MTDRPALAELIAARGRPANTARPDRSLEKTIHD